MKVLKYTTFGLLAVVVAIVVVLFVGIPANFIVGPMQTEAVPSGHSGTPAPPRTHPEWSDLALFAVAVLAVWFVRRALRRRFTED